MNGGIFREVQLKLQDIRKRNIFVEYVQTFIHAFTSLLNLQL